jgi:hypothetical protein
VIYIPFIIAFYDTLGSHLPVVSVINTVLALIGVLIKYRAGLILQQQLNPSIIREYFFHNGSWGFDIITMFPWTQVVVGWRILYKELMREQFVC